MYALTLIVMATRTRARSGKDELTAELAAEAVKDAAKKIRETSQAMRGTVKTRDEAYRFTKTGREGS